VPLFAAKVAESDVRAAMLRIARGEATLSGEARRLGYSKNGHRALSNRIKAIQKREAAALEASADRQALEKVRRDGTRRAVMHGHLQLPEAPEVGRTFPERYSEVQAALAVDHEAERRARRAADEEAARMERSGRRKAAGLQPNGGKVYRDGEARFLQERDDEKVAALQHAAEHPETLQRHGVYDLQGRWLASKPAGLTLDALDAWASTFRERHGLVELAVEEARGVRA
jgi:hypothetical protein